MASIRHIPRLIARAPIRPICTTRISTLSPIRHYSTPTTTSPATTSLFTPPGDPATSKPFYVTTPIFYVNASPHIGHLHSLLLTDVLARFSRLRHPERKAMFATGTDEHGMKIQQAAMKMGVDEQSFCDDVSQRFRDLAELANTSHTDFIRTTEPRHQKAVEHFWNKLVESGDIYKGTHAGWYSVSDESFYAASQVTKRESDGKMVAVENGNEVVWEEETNWKFRLQKHRQFLTEWLSQPDSVHPNPVRLNLLKQIPTLEDLSVSRPLSRVKWGIPVPNDPSQSIYVWVDALINYITVGGYPGGLEGWPADVHVVGKDIIKFHALHWPALLHSASLPPPRRIIAHAHWTMDHSKMSKSRGNVVDPIGAVGQWGVDGVRWYLMRVGGSLGDDAGLDYAPDQLEVHYRLLASQIGNLLSRLSSPKILNKATAPFSFSSDNDPELDGLLSNMRGEFERKMEVYGVGPACAGVMDVIFVANKLFTDLAPWSPETPSSTKAVTYAYHSLRLAFILLQPVIPRKAGEGLDRLGVPAERREWGDAVWPLEAEEGQGELVERMKEAGKRWKKKGVLFPLPAKEESV
ncbi:methionine-tRNA ligase [Cryptococcus amylolentus CBS 6039]|uniref:methionine--tRNA ligase n=1 Tax=Cryptococcus amylolentus CBS 6039 TaxID=1295533 RepID=A0A1E3HUM4_9TREE|nr:methionine-tRNA ligase [Cryptococcus amylolentus CBS 6039]ODN80043.1 methionine-tRNA ligase [Cryptococcus amylolentus CBS 6039]